MFATCFPLYLVFHKRKLLRQIILGKDWWQFFSACKPHSKGCSARKDIRLWQENFFAISVSESWLSSTSRGMSRRENCYLWGILFQVVRNRWVLMFCSAGVLKRPQWYIVDLSTWLIKWLIFSEPRIVGGEKTQHQDYLSSWTQSVGLASQSSNCPDSQFYHHHHSVCPLRLMQVQRRR